MSASETTPRTAMRTQRSIHPTATTLTPLPNLYRNGRPPLTARSNVAMYPSLYRESIDKWAPCVCGRCPHTNDQTTCHHVTHHNLHRLHDHDHSDGSLFIFFKSLLMERLVPQKPRGRSLWRPYLRMFRHKLIECLYLLNLLDVITKLKLEYFLFFSSRILRYCLIRFIFSSLL